jgi:plastocyanin
MMKVNISAACFLVLVSSAAKTENYATLTGDVSNFDVQPLIIYLEPVSKSRAITATKIDSSSISSHDSKFEPAFQVIQKGGILEIKNTDPILHNAHISENKITLFNVATPLKNQTVKKIMPRTGLFNVACDLHPWMKASLAVITSPYYSVLQKPGHFQINNIVPGKYHLHSLQAEKDEIITLLDLKANSEKNISF